MSQQVNPIVEFRDQLDRQIPEFRKVLPPSITPEEFARVTATAMANNPFLYRADRQSLFTALMKAAEDGLVPDGRQGALVPFKKNVKQGDNWTTFWVVQWMPMPAGLRKNLWDGPRINVSTKVVYPGDTFDYDEGDDPKIVHKPKSNGNGRSDDIIAVYAIAKDDRGQIIARDVMWKAEIDQIKALAEKRTEKGPWSNPVFYPEMAQKTVLHHICKSLPIHSRTQQTLDRDKWIYEDEIAKQPRDPLPQPAAATADEAYTQAWASLPSPDNFQQPMDTQQSRSVDTMLNKIGDGAKVEAPRRTRRTKEQIEADRKAILEREAQEKLEAEKAAVAQAQQAGTVGDILEETESNVDLGNFGGTLADKETGEVYEETSDDHDHEADEAAEDAKRLEAEARQRQHDEAVAAQKAREEQAHAAGNGQAPPARGLSAGEKEAYQTLVQMVNASRKVNLNTKAAYCAFIKEWLEKAENPAQHAAVRDYVQTSSIVREKLGVTMQELKAIAEQVGANRR